MAVSVNFYTFSKKENSTAQPSGGTSYNCQLRAPCGILNPKIRLDLGASGNPAGYNYAYIASFNRYYWVREWTNIGPIWEADLAVDVLASYKSAIGSSNLYALRSSYSYDGDIVDALYPCKADVDQDDISVTSAFSNMTGVYVCGIVSGGTLVPAAQVGSVKYYYLSAAGLETLCGYLLDTNNYSNMGLSVNDCELDLQKSLIDPLQYIKSCVWLPIDPTTVSMSTGTLCINGWNVPGVESAGISGKYVIDTSVTITIPKHPDALTRGDYLNGPGYTQLWMLAGPYGAFTLDSNMTAYESTLYLTEVIDVTSGMGQLSVRNSLCTIEKVRAMRGVSIQLSQITTDYIGATAAGIGGITGMIGSAMMGDIAGAIGSAVGGIANAAKAAAPKSTSVGGGGSFIDQVDLWFLNYIFFRPVDDDINHHGRPLCKDITVSSYPGYLLIQDVDIAIAATADELSKIRAYLESGFYYE